MSRNNRLFHLDKKGNRKENRNQLVEAVRERKSSIRTGSSYSYGAKTLIDLVMAPDGFEEQEWLAANTVDFYNELCNIHKCCEGDVVRKNYGPGEGFPESTTYHWDNGDNLSGPEYVEKVFKWMDDTLEDTSIFPVLVTENWPDDFRSQVKTIHKRLFRVFAIIYHCHYDFLKQQRNLAHLKAAFKHFIFFAIHWQLLDVSHGASGDVRPLQELVDRLHETFDREMVEWERQKFLETQRANSNP